MHPDWAIHRFGLALIAGLAAFAMAPEAWGQNCIAWHRIGTGPRLVDMVYDTQRDVLVGVSASTSGLQTWEYTAGRWALRDATTIGSLLPARFEFKLVYDSVRLVTVLYGVHTDHTSAVVGSETWEWNGSVWRSRDQDTVLAARGFAVAYDAARQVTILFDANAANGSRTWAWNGTSWVDRNIAGPSRRTYPGMTFDSQRNVVVAFGGASSSSNLRDTSEYDGTRWRTRSNSGPTGRRAPGMAFDPARGVTVLSGGTSSTSLQDNWTWNGSAWAQEPYSGARRPLVFDTALNALVGLVVTATEGQMWEYPCTEDCPTGTLPPAESLPGIRQNRYLVFNAPVSCESDPMAIRVTLTSLPGPGNDCRMPDFSANVGQRMWVGPEVLLDGAVRTGVRALSQTPVFEDWFSASQGTALYVSDCNVVPCGTYTIEAIREIDYPAGPFTLPLVLTTSPKWGDIAGSMTVNGATIEPDGIVDGLDIAVVVGVYRGQLGAISRSRCDLYGERPVQGVLLDIDALDVTTVVNAFRGDGYPFAGPSAPLACPGSP